MSYFVSLYIANRGNINLDVAVVRDGGNFFMEMRKTPTKPFLLIEGKFK